MTAPITRPPAPDPVLLVVEDDVDTLESLEALLRVAFPRLRVVAESDSRRAAQRLRDPGLCLVVADYLMADVDGVEVLREAQRVAPGAKRVLVTASRALVAQQGPTLKAVADLVRTKPLEPDAFVDEIARLLESE